MYVTIAWSGRPATRSFWISRLEMLAQALSGELIRRIVAIIFFVMVGSLSESHSFTALTRTVAWTMQFFVVLKAAPEFRSSVQGILEAGQVSHSTSWRLQDVASGLREPCF